MVALDFKEDTKLSTENESVSLSALSDLTGFPVEYIKKELMLNDDSELSVEELRTKVLGYLNSNF